MITELEIVANAAKEYLDLLMKPSLEQIGGLIGDKLAVIRDKNRIKLVQNVHQYHLKKGITEPKKIRVKYISQVFEEISYEEDEKIFELWTILLAKSTDLNEEYDLNPIAISILKQFGPLEATLICNLNVNSSVCMDLTSKKYSGDLNTKVAIDNLKRLGIVDYKNYNSKKRSLPNFLVLTELGKMFISLVTTQEPSEN